MIVDIRSGFQLHDCCSRITDHSSRIAPATRDCANNLVPLLTDACEPRMLAFRDCTAMTRSMTREIAKSIHVARERLLRFCTLITTYEAAMLEQKRNRCTVIGSLAH